MKRAMSRHDESAVVAATRAVAGDDSTSYDAVTIAFHWTTVVLVLVQFLLSQTWGLFARPARHLMIVGHMSFGIILTFVIVGRIIWRLIPGHQVPAIAAGWTEIAAKIVHYILYALLAAEAGLGFLFRWAGGEAMSFFGILISPPLAPFKKSNHELVALLHEKIGWAIIILAVGHALAALYHHYFLRDRILIRMLPHRSS